MFTGLQKQSHRNKEWEGVLVMKRNDYEKPFLIIEKLTVQESIMSLSLQDTGEGDSGDFGDIFN